MESSSATRPLAVVPRASSGIGLELAKQFAANGFDLILAAEDEAISAAAGQIDWGASVEAVQVDLATSEGVDELYGRVTAVGAQGHRGDRDLADAGPTETELFERADMLDTKVGAGEKAEMHRKMAEPGSAKEARPSLTRPGPGSRRSRSAPCGSPRRRFAPR